MLAHPFQITKSPAPSDPESEEGEAMTMEAIQDHKRPVANEPRREERRADRFYGGAGRGAGLYAEVRPITEHPSLVLESVDEA